MGGVVTLWSVDHCQPGSVVDSVRGFSEWALDMRSRRRIVISVSTMWVSWWLCKIHYLSGQTFALTNRSCAIRIHQFLYIKTELTNQLSTPWLYFCILFIFSLNSHLTHCDILYIVRSLLFEQNYFSYRVLYTFHVTSQLVNSGLHHLTDTAEEVHASLISCNWERYIIVRIAKPKISLLA